MLQQCCQNKLLSNNEVMHVQSVLILCINLLERRYESIIFIATDCILVDPLTKGLDVKLFKHKMNLAKPSNVLG